MIHGLFPKFAVRHHSRGPLPDGDVFVLVPRRDPAAAAAVRAYANATDDPALADALHRWMDAVEGVRPVTRELGIEPRLAAWVRTLSAAVQSGAMPIETALQRIAGHAADAARRHIGADSVRPTGA